MRARQPLIALLVATCLTPLWAAPASADFGDRTLRLGMRGGDVAKLQRKLTRLGFETTVDRYFGPETEQSQKRYERRYDRNVNGVCSRKDARHIERVLAEQRQEPAPEGDYTYGSRTMRAGHSGSDVAELQRLLTRQGLATPVTGTFGDDTTTSVKRWEAWRYKIADGEVTPKQAAKIKALADQGAVYVHRKHVFPVRGPHDYGGAGSRFGAPRTGHTHMGQDVAAAKGTKLVAAHTGRVSTRQYQAGGAGHYLVIQGRDDSDSVYMHMPRVPLVAPGDFVRAGEKIGSVGCTGSCTGPHLHFELWTPHWYDGGEAYDPLPKLKRWDEKT